MKSMRIFIIFSLFCISRNLYGQSVDYNKIIIPKDAPGPLEFSEKLVQLAWENLPENKILQVQLEEAETQMKTSKWNWLSNISISSNFNEFSINPPPELEGNIYFPRYNISLGITLGTFVSYPSSIKTAKANKVIAEEQLKNQKIQLRARVLSTYQNFLMSEKLLQIQLQATEEEYSRYLLAEDQFKKTSLTLEKYNDAISSYNAQRAAKISAETAYLNAKIVLEALIGLKLEEVE
ncbi:TolC family protein [Chondrinema litorale]|uniref:TolC family protein n=1 Tax=Chondrinema litorale TaxID=2994555 RepID=UPI002543E72E|nr:TolC family protein [Chondrinema litorale]UZS00144.1 TolC family protein [Chondrinema litorale]